MLGLEIVLVILSVACCYLIYKLLELKQKNKKLKLYEDITKNVLNSDPKTRKKIEELCNAYLEHKVINSKIVNENYLNQVQLVLDDIKFINTIYAIEPYEDKRERKEQLANEQAEQNANAIQELQEESNIVEKAKRGRKTKKEDNAEC